jgi:hypothetical protein
VSSDVVRGDLRSKHLNTFFEECRIFMRSGILYRQSDAKVT